MIINNYKNKTVIVTGGGTGIGYEIAKLFLEHGAKTNIVGRRQDILTKAKQRMKEELSVTDDKIFSLKHDMSKEKSVIDLFNKIHKKFNRIDILINNCGTWMEKPIDKFSESEIDNQFKNIIKSTILSTKHVVKYMKNEGVIINIGSFAGIMPMKNSSVYSSLKSAVHTFTKSSASELGINGIRVNCIIPGVIRTPMTSKYIDDNYNQIIKPISLQKIGTTMDIANAVIFLCSNKAKYITGAMLEVTGGKFSSQL